MAHSVLVHFTPSLSPSVDPFHTPAKHPLHLLSCFKIPEMQPAVLQSLIVSLLLPSSCLFIITPSYCPDKEIHPLVYKHPLSSSIGLRPHPLAVFPPVEWWAGGGERSQLQQRTTDPGPEEGGREWLRERMSQASCAELALNALVLNGSTRASTVMVKMILFFYYLL